MYWLIPRIADFHRQHPEVLLQFNMNYGQFDAVRDRIGIAIPNTMVEAPPDLVVKELGPERIRFVCSPEYLRDSGLITYADVAAAHRRAPSTRPNVWNEWAHATQHEGSPLTPSNALIRRVSAPHVRA